MIVSCLLTSYNRPRWLRHALRSVQDQTHKDYELFVLDESTAFDVHEVIREFKFTRVHVHHFEVKPEERGAKTRLSVNINFAMPLVRGDLVCFLCDDDYYYPGWFESAVRYFEMNPNKHVGYGKLIYSSNPEMIFPKHGRIRFYDGPIGDPYCRLDHNQVIHRTTVPRFAWPEDAASMGAPDGLYFQQLAKKHLFHPIEAFAVVKREHAKALQKEIDAIRGGTAEPLRE